MAQQRYHLVTIGDEERRLRFGRAPLIDAQKMTGKTVGQLFSGLISMDIEAMQAILWAALRTESPTTSYNEAGRIFDQWMDEGATLVDIQVALNQAAIASGLFSVKQTEGEVADEGDGSAPKVSKSGRTK